ncbi:peptidase domain-containing ABC transporter [Paenibacillus chitinolyticus]
MLRLSRKPVCIRQHDRKDCAPACLAAVARYYGLKMPLSLIREACGTDHTGTNAYGIVQGAGKLGFTAEAVKGDAPALFAAGFELPAIAHVIDKEVQHYVVIYKITPDKVLAADPAEGMRTYKTEQFLNLWTGVLILLTPGESFKPGSRVTGAAKRFFPLLRRNRKLLLPILAASLLVTVIGMAGAFYFQILLDTIMAEKLQGTLTLVSVGIIVLYAVQTLLDFARNHLFLYLAQRIDRSLVLDYYNHVISLPMSFFSSRKTGEITSRLTDASNVRDALSEASLHIAVDSLTLLIAAAVLYNQNPLLFGLTLLLVPVYVLIMAGFRGFFDRYNRKMMNENAELTSYVIESIKGIETVKASTAQREVKEAARAKYEAFLATAFKYGLMNNVQSALKTALQLISGVVLLWIGARQVLEGEITAGRLITFNVLLAYFLSPLQRLIDLQPVLQSAYVAASRLGEYMDLAPEKELSPEEAPVSGNSLDLRGDLLIRNLSYRYGSRPLTLDDVNLTIREGSSTALVGPSGSGKTSLLKLLMKFFEAEQGSIEINGHDLRDIPAGILRSRIAYVPQETFFYHGTVYDNLCLGLDPKPSLEKVAEVCKQAQIHDFIASLPQHYETVLEENGSNLSGGQRQRLSVARALMKKPHLLLMDEATSSLDAVTEKAVSSLSAGLGITTVMISHRLSGVRHCDRICVMDRGRIVETGSHDELVQQGGAYSALWNSQFAEAQAAL